MTGHDAIFGPHRNALTRVMAVDLARYGITVNNVVTGALKTKPSTHWPVSRRE